MNLNRTFTQINTLLDDLFNDVFAQTADLDQAEADIIALQGEVDALEAQMLTASELTSEQTLAINAISIDVDGKKFERFKVSYNTDKTLTFQNVGNLLGFSAQITNSNSNVLIFVGLNLYFKSSDLPIGVSFDNNTLSFPADSSVVYKIRAVKEFGVFEAEIKVR